MENNIKKRSVTEFFKKDKPVWAVYDATRKLPSYIDGFKNSQRKLIWTGFEKASKDFVKTEVFCNITALDLAYIHGASNLCGVCASLVQDFIGACNYPYFEGNDGGWGSRLITKESAPRYTKLKMGKLAKSLFDKTDCEVLQKQWFEGQWIEPKYLIPVFPTIFLNSSSGLTAGFSENIYSRDPEKVIEYIKRKIAGTEKPRVELAPWFKNYCGIVRKCVEGEGYESVGAITRNNTTSYTITEIPVETSYQKYVEMLDKMEEDGDIQGYSDKCNPRTNEILFEIKTTREFTRKHEDEESLLKVFKLVKTLPEQYNCIDENGCVREFKDVYEILDAFIELRLRFYADRKAKIVSDIKNALVKLSSKWYFVKAVVDGEIVVAKKRRDEIVAQIEKNKKIAVIDGSYEYLLSMPIYSLSAEKLDELKKQIADLKAEYDSVSATTIQQMWTTDLTSFKKAVA